MFGRKEQNFFFPPRMGWVRKTQIRIYLQKNINYNKLYAMAFKIAAIHTKVKKLSITATRFSGFPFKKEKV